VGLPGYSGQISNPMLARSLIEDRELLLSGAASLFDEGPGDPSFPVWPPGAGGLPPAQTPTTLQRLQANVRAVLAEQELLQGISIVPMPSATRKIRLQLDAPVIPIVTLEAPPLDVFIKQLKLVDAFSDLRSERTEDILAQVVPQSAHWSAIAGLTPERHRYTYEVLGIGLRFAMMQVMRFKHALECPRPIDLSRRIQPMILTPGYSAFPSGHSTEAHFLAELLTALMSDAGRPDAKEPGAGGKQRSLQAQLNRLAHRVAENRVVAGLHYPLDSLAGQVLGVSLAHYVAWACNAAGWEKVGGEFPVITDGTPLEDLLPKMDLVLDPACMVLPGQTLLPGNPNRTVLSQMWTLAVAECRI
jgi:membrane-associated phospholipid phosphatase